MAVHYDTFGPFELEREGGQVPPEALASFWKNRKTDSVKGLDGAVGVYIFCVQAKKVADLKPWYVGRTDKQGFKKRFSQQHLHFRQVLDKAKNGTLQIYLIALKAPGNKRLRKPTTNKITANNWLESMLITSCLDRNKQLINASKVKHLKTLVVPGYLNNKVGKLSLSAASLKKTLKVD
jgi:hypothetical protein